MQAFDLGQPLTDVAFGPNRQGPKPSEGLGLDRSNMNNSNSSNNGNNSSRSNHSSSHNKQIKL